MTAPAAGARAQRWYRMDDPSLERVRVAVDSRQEEVPRLFAEAVQQGCDIGLRGDRLDDVIVRPHYFCVDDSAAALWAFVFVRSGNRHFALRDVREFCVLPEGDLALRATSRCEARLLASYPSLAALDKDLRVRWCTAAERPDYDPRPFEVLDARLGDLAEASRALAQDLEKL